MPRGQYPTAYFNNPVHPGPLSAIYNDLDAYTGEFFANEPHLHPWVNAHIIVPPLYYQGRFLKGLLVSQAIDLLAECFPHIKQLFLLGAHSMWCSYAWATQADVILTCYNNPNHLAHYTQTHPDRAHLAYVPLLDTDFTNEAICYPRPQPASTDKDIDLLCIARLHNVKNLPHIARALKLYAKKYGQRLRTTLVVGKPFDVNRHGLDPHEQNQLRQLERILDHNLSAYITLVPYAHYYTQLPQLFNRSRCYTLTSLIEGKNRGMREALLYDVPVVAYEAHNQWARGSEDPLLPHDRCGIAVPHVDDEALADAWHTVLTQPDYWSPRLHSLPQFSRKQAVNTCLSHIPYYLTQLPEQWFASQPADTPWLDAAVLNNYGLSYHSFIYDRHPFLSHTQGLTGILPSLNFYLQRFSLPPVDMLPTFN
jgi:glycosyltransferase involved in cell wall biosynthesis